MKKTILIFILSSLTLFSCSDKNENYIIDLKLEMQKIKSNVIHNNINISSYSKTLINKDFFETIDKIRLIQDTELKNKSLILFSENFHSYRMEKALCNEEVLILKSYFDAINNSSLSKILITEYYINEIKNLNIEEKSKKNSLEFLSYYKDFLIYINYDNITISNVSVLKNKHNDCYKRSCFDCCMYKKSKALDESNWVEKAIFIATLPESMLAWIASCSWDCITN